MQRLISRERPFLSVLAAVLLTTATPWLAAAEPGAPPSPHNPSATVAQRPRIGLVLSGGGARGLAHVGVLKMLERERVPVDAIAGTSMGAIIGGMYASGMTATEIEQRMMGLDWDELFSQRVSRRLLSQRRKEEDYDIATAIELGFRDGRFRAPPGAVSSRGLESLLRDFTLPVRHIDRFDQLPIPFRAVCTDMETGDMVLMSRGDLALAMRSSMSVPGVFPSTEVDGRLLGDGGLVRNLPVEVARAMGVDLLIVVNIGTPISSRDNLQTVIGQTGQMINILTDQNVARSLSAMQPQDVLINPDLGGIGSSDFNQAIQIVALGESAAQVHGKRLATLALSEADYATWRTARRAPPQPTQIIREVAYAGVVNARPEHLSAQLLSAPGTVFNPEAAARDVRRFAASGDYARTDYRLLPLEGGDAKLVFDLQEKPWGPDYLHAGLNLSTDFTGRGEFALNILHNRHWLTPSGTEWRNRVQIGESPLVYTELYQPINRTIGVASDWFASGYAGAERLSISFYDRNGGHQLGQLRRGVAQFGLDLGQPWGSLGEIRLGYVHRVGRTLPILLSEDYEGTVNTEIWQEVGVRGRLVVDQLDHTNFPTQGYRFYLDGMVGERRHDVRERMGRVEADATLAYSVGRHTLSLYGEAKASDSNDNAVVGQYGLGGFHHLSGYQTGQVSGNALLYGRAGWYMRLSETPVFARGLFVGGTVEAGDAWQRHSISDIASLRTGFSLYVGADTGIGPMYLGVTWAPRGDAGLILHIGRP